MVFEELGVSCLEKRLDSLSRFGSPPQSCVRNNCNSHSKNGKNKVKINKIIYIHIFSLVNNKLIVQKTRDVIVPNSIIARLNLSTIKGIATEAKAICAISEHISESLFNLVFVKSIA